jgi:hypothetical protein
MIFGSNAEHWNEVFREIYVAFALGGCKVKFEFKARHTELAPLERLWHK